MPNWCENRIYVRPIFDGGRSATEINNDFRKLEKILKSEKSDVTFENILPTPKGYLDDDRWYQWRIENWGTKWEPDSPTVSFGSEDGEINFLSAWSPPIGITKKLSLMFPKLEFEHVYEESGMDFSGVTTYVNGEVTLEKSGSFGDIRIFDDDYYEWAFEDKEQAEEE